MMTDGGTRPRLRQSVAADTVNRKTVTAVENVTSSASGAAGTQEVVCALKGACCSSVDDVSVWFPLPVCDMFVSF